MSRKSVSFGAINCSVVAQQTHSHSTDNLFKLNQLTCSILAASALLLSASAMAANPAPITNQEGANGTGTITVNAGEIQEIGGTALITLGKKVTGEGGLTKKNTGIVTLNVSNDYHGETKIENGTLKAGVAGAFSGNSVVNITVDNGILDLGGFNQTIKGLKGTGQVKLGTRTVSGTQVSGLLTIDTDNDQTYSGNIGTIGDPNTNGGLTKLGTGTLTLNGSLNNTGDMYTAGGFNAVAGNTTITKGTLKLGANGLLSSKSNISLGGMGTLDISQSTQPQLIRGLTDTSATDNGGTIELGTRTLTTSFGGPTTFSGHLNGTTGGLTIIGTGTLTLNGTNSYSGDTTISKSARATNVGTLKAGQNNVFSANSTVNLTDVAAILDLNGTTQTIASLTGSGKVYLAGGTLTTDFASSGESDAGVTFSGVIGKSAADAGNLTKQGTGTLILTGTNLYTGKTTVSGGTLQLSKTTNGDIEITEHGNLSFNFSDEQTQAHTLTGTGTLTKAGDGNLTLSGTNSGFKGNVIIRNGKLAFATGAAPTMGKSISLAGSGATLDLMAGGDIELNNLASVGNITLGANLTATYTGDTPSTIAGNIAGANNFTKAGTGTLIFSGANNGFTGNTTVKAGTLQLTKNLNSNISIEKGATLEFGNTDELTYNKDIGGTGSLTKTGAGKAVLAGINQYSGTTTISAGTLELHQLPGNTPEIKIAENTNLSVTGSGDLDAILSGKGDVRIAVGAGTLRLGGVNTYEGKTFITTGTVQAKAANAFSASSAVDIASGATLDLATFGDQSIGTLTGVTGSTIDLKAVNLTTTSGANSTFAGKITGTGGLTKAGTGTLILSGAANDYQGATTISNGTLQLDKLPTATSKITVTGAASTLAINNADAQTFAASKIAGTEGTFKKMGEGELTLNGAASDFAGTTLVEAGTLKFAIADAIKASVLNISATGIVDLANSNQTFAGLEGAGGELKTTATGNLTLDTAADKSFTFDGKITGAGTVTKTGTGTQIFNSADNNTTGAVTVNTGTLLIGADTAHNTAKFTSSAITVENGATLGGFGTIAAPVTVNSGGFLSPGSDTATGTLTFDNANLTFKTGSVLNYHIKDSDDAGNADHIRVTGSGMVTIENDSILRIKPGAERFRLGHTYTVITSAQDINKQGEGFKTEFDTEMPFLEPVKVDYADDHKTVKFTVKLKSDEPVVPPVPPVPPVNPPVVNPPVVPPVEKTLPAAGSPENANFTSLMNDTVNNTIIRDQQLDTPAVKTGSGKRIINAEITARQGITVSNGILQVDDGTPIEGNKTKAGKIIGNVDVASGGTLQGHGTVDGAVSIETGGTLSPGGSFGVLTVTGDLSYKAGAKYDFEMDAHNVEKDSINVGGIAKLDKNAILVLKPQSPADSNLWRAADGKRYTVVQATGAGTIKTEVKDPITIDTSEAKNLLNFLYVDPLIYTDKAIVLTLSLKPDYDTRFTRYAKNRNQLSVARAVTSLPHRGEEALFSNFAGLTSAEIPAGLNNLSPEIYASASDSLLQNSHYVRDAVLQNHQDNSQLWITAWGHGGRSQGDRQYTDSSVSNQGWGVAVGGGIPLAKHVAGGVMAGYERTTVNGHDASDARARINAAHIGAYLRADLNSVNLNGGLIYSFLNQNTDRRISLVDLHGKLNNDNSGHQVQLFAELNRDFHLATSTTLTPYVNVAQVWQTMGESSEKALGSAGPAAVHMDRDNKGVTFTGLGLRGVITLPTAVPASLQFAAGWQHAFGDTHSAIISSFTGSRENTSTHGTGLARDSALINTGLNIKTSASSSLTISYQGEFGAGHTDNAGKLQWQLQF